MDERYETLGKIIKNIDGSGNYNILEWSEIVGEGRDTRITSDGEIILERKINRETYNWGVQ